MYRWVRERHMIGIRGRNFLEAPWAGGVVLLGCVIVAMLLANLPGTSLYYRHLLETDLSLMVHSPDGLIDWVFPRGMTVEKLINDGLMVIFFFAVGLEIKREIVCGQLSSARQAILPVLAAAGGMLAPAIIFLFFNHGTIAANGWGIPTATDIAFAIGILSMLGDRVPVSLKIFLTALAIADDLGLELKIENVDFDTIVPGVASGTKYDMGIAAITATPEREKEVGFTDSYYMDDQAIVTMADNTEITGDNYADALNAEGVKIAVQSGSTAEAFAKENFPNAELVPFKNATDCFAAVQSSQANALVTNRSVAAQLVATSFSNEQVIKQISTGEEYAIAVNKDNTALLDALNDSIAKLTEDGTVDELMTKYNIK